jgi:hypothetical protein
MSKEKPLQYAKRSLRSTKTRKEAENSKRGLSYPSAVSGGKSTVKLVVGKYYKP